MDVDRELYQELIAPIEDRMTRVVYRIVRDPEDAADALQDALMKVWKDLRRIHRHPNPHGYILRLCVSAAHDLLRKRMRTTDREQPLNTELLVDERSGPTSSVVQKEREEAILKAIARLPRNQASAVYLRIVENESFESIARSLGCRETTARSHVSKGKASLREMLSEVESLELEDQP